MGIFTESEGITKVMDGSEYSVLGIPLKSETTLGANPVTGIRNPLEIGAGSGSVGVFPPPPGLFCTTSVSEAGVEFVAPCVELRAPVGIVFW
jgi:hypothetical protein